MPAPLITVLITAYSRKAFLEYALHSVGKQALDPESYEIVVVTNLRDESLIGRLMGIVRFEHVYDDSRNAGGQIAAGLENSTGRYVALLDDDDVWLPQKLGISLTRLAESDGPLYYAHTPMPFGIESRYETLSTTQESTHGRLYDGKMVRLDMLGPDETAVAETLEWFPGNNSCAVFDRRLVLRRIQHLREVRASIDHFLLFAALSAKGKLVLERIPLAMYRLHSENASRQATRRGFGEFRAHLTDYSNKILADNLVFARMAAESNSQTVKDYLSFKIRFVGRLCSILEGRRVGAADSIREALVVLSQGGDTYSSKFWRLKMGELLAGNLTSTNLLLAVAYLSEQKRLAKYG